MGYILKMGQIATIRTGHTFKTRVRDAASGNIHVYQPADIDRGTLVAQPVRVDFSMIRNLDHHRLFENDILLANKGHRFSTFIHQDAENISVAASSFFVIRADSHKVDYRYLAWYLGQPETKQMLEARSSASTVPSLKLSDIRSLPVIVPEMAIQNKIIQAVDMGKQEETILIKLQANRQQSIESFCWELIRNGE